MFKHLFTLLLAFMLFIYGCDKHASSSSDANASESTANGAPGLEEFKSVLVVVCGGVTATVDQLREWSNKYA